MIQLLHGDAREMLTTLEAESVQTVVTSPPYYGLRKYTDDPREIGQEATPALYVTALVAVFREVWRVLRNDGCAWINLGDSYGTGSGGNGTTSAKQRSNVGGQIEPRAHLAGMNKQLLGIPWRVAFALQDDGWILRSDCIWSKPNCMPESVTDRPTRAHEYLFLFAKQARYFYDAAAIAEPAIYAGDNRAERTDNTQEHGRNGDDSRKRTGKPTGVTRNKRTVWTIATRAYSEAHFATMPEALIEPCILAGSSAQACETCGAAWGRVTERESVTQRPRGTEPSQSRALGQPQQAGVYVNIIDKGFASRCACEVNTGGAASVVLDPFGGSGTVARVAERYQRNAILIDLNQAYIELQERRTDGVQVELFV